MGWETPSPLLVVGLGSSGVAAARLGAARGAEVRVTDVRGSDELGPVLERLPSGTRTFLGGHPEGCLEGVRLVVASPGVPADAPLLLSARERGVPLLTEIEFAWLHRAEVPLAAVTGSNGKSTVTTLIAEMLRAAGVAAVAGGNLGPPASELVATGPWDAWVLEVSSFQAELLTAMRPRVAVFLNLSQDHLERHPDLASYRDAKARLLAFQEAGDAAVLNHDDAQVRGLETAARRLSFSLETASDAWLDDDRLMLAGELLTTADQVALSGRHNLANALAAALAARELGAPVDAVVRALGSFTGLPHRHRTIAERDGIRWIDDSKATNVGATLAALGGYPAATVHLILGGQAKGQDFSVLAGELRRAVVAVYLIGVDAPVIAGQIGDVVAVRHCGTLADAVARARTAAEPGQVVLLAPACASFDQFSGYAARGTRFAELAREEVAPCR